MSKKTLLSESQVRQFMKLAQLTPLTPGFVEGLTENTTEDLEESHGRGIGENPPHSRLEEEADDAEKVRAIEDELSDEDSEADREGDEIDDLEADLDAADAGDGAEQMISVGDLMDALTSALEDVTGQPVEASVEDEVEADVVDIDAAADLEVDAADMEADTDMEMELQEAGESTGDQPAHIDYEDDNRGPDCEGGDCAGDEGEGEGGHNDYKQEGVEATDELVEQITKRVAARILKSALAKK